jgi:hypothetical protein
MTISWNSLLAVFLVSLTSTVAVVLLIALAMLGLSARAPRVVRSDAQTRHPLVSASTGTAVAGACLAAAAGIVLFGLWEIVAR